jgi:hypothetical protein
MFSKTLKTEQMELDILKLSIREKEGISLCITKQFKNYENRKIISKIFRS